MKIPLTAELSTKEEDAIEVFSSLLLPTNFICAFFKRLDFAVSKSVVITKKSAQTPISGFDKLRIRITKFTKPNIVTANRCRKVKKADRTQYDERYFFKGEALKLAG
jgi:hypothetical protein